MTFTFHFDTGPKLETSVYILFPIGSLLCIYLNLYIFIFLNYFQYTSGAFRITNGVISVTVAVDTELLTVDDWPFLLQSD